MTPSDINGQGREREDAPELCREGASVDSTLLTTPVGGGTDESTVYACT